MKMLKTFAIEIENNLEKLMNISRRKWLLSVIDKNMFEKETHILDLGGGNGTIPFYLYTKGFKFKYLGIDKKKRQIRIGNKLFKRNKMKDAKCIYCDFDYSLPFDDSTFSQAWLIGAYVRGFKSEYQNVFNEVYRVLKPGGLFLFDAPSEDEKREKYQHRLLSKKQINDIIDKKFTIISIQLYVRNGSEERHVGHPQRTDDEYHYWGIVCKKIGK